LKDYAKIIKVNKNKRAGRYCVRNLRVAVCDVIGWLASGMTNEEIIEEHPDLTLQDLQACLSFAADRDRSLN
jgi:uncharacterized protein (DUF433 family)